MQKVLDKLSEKILSLYFDKFVVEGSAEFIETIIKNICKQSESLPTWIGTGLVAAGRECQLDKLKTILKHTGKIGTFVDRALISITEADPNQYPDQLECVELLLEHGADPNYKSIKSSTEYHSALKNAARNRSIDVVTTLLIAGAKDDIVNAKAVAQANNDSKLHQMLEDAENGILPKQEEGDFWAKRLEQMVENVYGHNAGGTRFV